MAAPRRRLGFLRPTLGFLRPTLGGRGALIDLLGDTLAQGFRLGVELLLPAVQLRLDLLNPLRQAGLDLLAYTSGGPLFELCGGGAELLFSLLSETLPRLPQALLVTLSGVTGGCHGCLFSLDGGRLGRLGPLLGAAAPLDRLAGLGLGLGGAHRRLTGFARDPTHIFGERLDAAASRLLDL